MKAISLALSLSLLASISSAAPQFVREGEYSVGNHCRARVYKYPTEGLYEVMISLAGQYRPARFELNLHNNTVASGPGLCGQDRYPASTVGVTSNEQSTTYRLVCGGAFHPMYGRSEIVFDKNRGEFTAFTGLYRLATFSLPSGWHSGPIKSTVYDFSCDR